MPRDDWARARRGDIAKKASHDASYPHQAAQRQSKKRFKPKRYRYSMSISDFSDLSRWNESDAGDMNRDFGRWTCIIYKSENGWSSEVKDSDTGKSVFIKECWRISDVMRLAHRILIQRLHPKIVEKIRIIRISR